MMMIEDLENWSLKFPIVGDFLTNLKQEFENEDDKSVKAAELKRIEQEAKIIEEFVQEFRRVTRESGFKGWALIKEFK